MYTHICNINNKTPGKLSLFNHANIGRGSDSLTLLCDDTLNLIKFAVSRDEVVEVLQVFRGD